MENLLTDLEMKERYLARQEADLELIDIEPEERICKWCLGTGYDPNSGAPCGCKDKEENLEN